MGGLRRDLLLAAFDDTNAVDNARQAVSEDGNESGNRRQQEYRGNGKLDDMANVIDFNEGKQGALLCSNAGADKLPLHRQL